MQEHDLSYVRMEMINAREAPLRERGFVRWFRVNLFATPLDTVMTLLGLLFVAYFLPPVIRWALIDAVWAGPDRSVCATVAQGASSPMAGRAPAGLSSTPSSRSSCMAVIRSSSAGVSI